MRGGSRRLAETGGDLRRLTDVLRELKGKTRRTVGLQAVVKNIFAPINF